MYINSNAFRLDKNMKIKIRSEYKLSNLFLIVGIFNLD